MSNGQIELTLENIRINRANVLNLKNELKAKFIRGYFTIGEMIKYYQYSIDSAKLLIELLSKNGFLNLQIMENSNSNRYTFVNDKKKQIENIRLWYERAKYEADFLAMNITVINEEIEAEDKDNEILKMEK